MQGKETKSTEIVMTMTTNYYLGQIFHVIYNSALTHFTLIIDFGFERFQAEGVEA